MEAEATNGAGRRVCTAPLHVGIAAGGTAGGTVGGAVGGEACSAVGGEACSAAGGAAGASGGGWLRVHSAVMRAAAGGRRVGEQVGSAGAASGARLRTGVGAGVGAAGELAASIVEREEQLLQRVAPSIAAYRRHKLGSIAVAGQRAIEQQKELQQKAGRHLQERHDMSKGQYYFLSMAAMVTLVCVALLLLRSCLSLLGSVQLVWWLTRTDHYDEFRVWTLEVCKDEWQQETLLCEAARGSWLARELVRAKLATRDTDHCDPKDPKGKGCRYEPCAAHPKGLAKALLDVADGWRSPLNRPTDKLYLALRPVRKPLRAVLHDLASGRVSFSELDKILTAFPFGEKIEAEGWLATRTAALKTKLMHKAIYPNLRTWGLVIGGAPTPPAKRCAAPKAAPVATTHERTARGDGAATDRMSSDRTAIDRMGSGVLGFLREAHGMLGSLLQPPPPSLFANSREWRSAKLSKDGALPSYHPYRSCSAKLSKDGKASAAPLQPHPSATPLSHTPKHTPQYTLARAREVRERLQHRAGARVAFVLSGSKRPLSARAVDCSSAGQQEPPLAVQANEATPLRPGQVVRVGKGADTACFRNVYDNVYDKETASARASGSAVSKFM